MEPSLRDGDRLVATRVFAAAMLRRGNIVVFYPSGFARSKRFTLGIESPPIKRIVALPGDQIPVATASEEPRRLARDSYFLLGDNRARSIDSRMWGAIQRQHFLALFLFKLPNQTSRRSSSVGSSNNRDTPILKIVRSLQDCKIQDLTGHCYTLHDIAIEGTIIAHIDPSNLEAYPIVARAMQNFANSLPQQKTVILSIGSLANARQFQVALKLHEVKIYIALERLISSTENQIFPAFYVVSATLGVDAFSLDGKRFHALVKDSNPWSTIPVNG